MLIKESTRRRKEGAELSQQTREALTKIIEGVEETAKDIAEIARATEEQSQTTAEVSTGIQNVASITENNATAAEEMAGSSEELSGQATQLKELVGAFNIETSGGSTGAQLATVTAGKQSAGCSARRAVRDTSGCRMSCGAVNGTPGSDAPSENEQAGR